MDDCVVHGPTGPVLVASLDLCVDRVQRRRAVHRLECTPRCHLSYNLPRCCADQLWFVRQPLAGVQPRSYGMVNLWSSLTGDNHSLPLMIASGTAFKRALEAAAFS